MSEHSIGRLDPERLKEERHNVDFGTIEETGHDHLDREPGKAPKDDQSLREPTSGPIPPAR
jgi:hypothetical protein